MLMKQKRLILMAAAVAVMMMACEPEKVITPEPEQPAPSEPETLTSLVGTVWNNHSDTWETYNGYNYHLIIDRDLWFLTDSNGHTHSYYTPTEGVPASEFYFGFYYTYDPLTYTGIMEDSSMVQMGGNVQIYDLRYDAAQDAILLILPSDTSQYAVYTRVQ